MARKKTGKKASFRVPSLKDVQARTLIPRGSYKAKVKSVESGEGDSAPYFKWIFEIISGKMKGQQPKPYYTSMAETALFNIKGLLEAVGYKIPKGEFDLDPADVIDEELTISIDHEVYENRKQSVVVGFGDEGGDDDEDSDDEDEDEKEDDDEDEDEDDDDDDDDDDDEDDDEDDEDDRPRRKKSKSKKGRKARR